MHKQIVVFVAVALAFIPSLAAAGGCGDGSCSVGHFGQGGDSSDGKAQGTLTRQPSTDFPGETLTEAGNESSGHIDVSNQGKFSGTLQDGTFRGHTTGIFGNWSGQCPGNSNC